MKKILALLLLSGCVIAGPQAPQGPVEWQQGYMDGCQSGEDAAGYVYARWKKDVQRAEEDKLYKVGWQDGYDRCKSNMQDTKELARSVMRRR